MRAQSDDTIYRFQKGAEDRFWKASVVGNVLTISEGEIANPETAEVRTYKMPRGGIHLADEPIELANRGYHQIDPDEFNAAVRELRGTRRAPNPKTGSAAMTQSTRNLYIYRFQRGSTDRFWKADARGDVVTISEGRMDNPDAAQIRTYSLRTTKRRLMEERLQLGNMGYYQIRPKAFFAAVREATSKRRTTPSRPDSTRPARRTSPVTPAQRTSRPLPKRRRVARAGPYAAAMTGPTFYVPRFRPIGQYSAEDPPRNTSGGRPILADGQPWPVCGYCEERMSLYLQFDIEDRFELAFPAGCHFLLFHCVGCQAIPLSPGGKVPAKWLRPDFRSVYRIIVNPPGSHEVIHEPDARVTAQTVTFAKRREKVKEHSDGPIGVEEVKVGGLPHWRQPPHYPTCSCGNPMGFVMQVPTTRPVGWMRKTPDDLPFAGGMQAYLFACSILSSPYAAVIIPQ